MSSEVPLLTFAEKDAIARQAQIDFCLGKAKSYDGALANGIEQAVRAQWAAEVAKRDQEIADLIEAGKTWNAQRDSAQAEAKAIKEKLQDPAMVHVALLRKEIARPSIADILHIYGEEDFRAALREQSHDE